MLSSSFSYVLRTVAAIFLAGFLAGCVDITLELAVVDENNGVGITTIAMDRAFYDSNVKGDPSFCESEDVLTLTDTSATCEKTESGSFAELFGSNTKDEPSPQVTSVGPGLVRVTFPTGVLADELTGAGNDPASLAMMEQFFDGHFIVVKVSGAKIVESDMQISDDGKSASFTIPFVELIRGEFKLPAETYAVVKTN